MATGGGRPRCPQCNFVGDPGDATCARCGAGLRVAAPVAGRAPVPADVRAFQARAAAERDAAAAHVSGWRRRRNLIDVVGGGLAYAGTFWLWFGSPWRPGALWPFVMSVGLGTVAGALSAWRRGGFAALIWGGAAILDLALVSGIELFRFLTNTVLGLALGFSRRMDRMEGL